MPKMFKVFSRLSPHFEYCRVGLSPLNAINNPCVSLQQLFLQCFTSSVWSVGVLSRGVLALVGLTGTPGLHGVPSSISGSSSSRSRSSS